jgi:hypothetical protein
MKNTAINVSALRHNSPKIEKDPPWNLRETEAGNLPESEAAFNKKFLVWERRNWPTWLDRHLSFPFMVKRVEDEDDAYFTDIAKRELFRLGHEMKIVATGSEILPREGILAYAEEGGRRAWVPLMDLEVASKTDPNYCPLREYVVWFANR